MSITQSYNQFAFDLYKRLNDKPGQNVFLSPYSIASVLSMCYAGARENTEKQLKELLSISHLTNDDIHKLNSELFDHLKSLQTEDVQLNIANKLYPKQGYQIRQEFLDTVQKFYSSAVESLDYSNTAQSANTINKWVENETKGKIKELIDESILNDLVRLIVVNAIYFKGNWLQKFDSDLTSKEEFHLSDGTTANVDMMHLNESKFCIRVHPNDLPMKVCEFPYKDETTALTIILPDENVDISEIESKLNGDTIHAIFQANKFKTKVNAAIPKFKLEESFELSNQLSEMGASDAFDSGKADFSGINENGGIHISKVIHKAVFEINEEGSEAAAATAAVMKFRMAVRPPEDLICNRPFIFIIHDIKHDTILFIGKYANPN